MRNLFLSTILVLFASPALSQPIAEKAQNTTVDFQGAAIVINAESPSDDRFVLPTDATEVLKTKKVNLTEMQSRYATLQSEIQKLTLQLSFDGESNGPLVAKINAKVVEANDLLVFLEDAEHDFVVEKDVFLANPEFKEPLARVD